MREMRGEIREREREIRESPSLHLDTLTTSSADVICAIYSVDRPGIRSVYSNLLVL